MPHLFGFVFLNVRGVIVDFQVNNEIQEGVALCSLEVVGRVKTWVLKGEANREKGDIFFACAAIQST